MRGRQPHHGPEQGVSVWVTLDRYTYMDIMWAAVQTDNGHVQISSPQMRGGASAKLALARRITALVDERGLNQVEAAQVMRMPQPKVSAIRNGKLRGISLERLLQALADLGQHVDIVVTPSTPTTPAGISVPF